MEADADVSLRPVHEEEIPARSLLIHETMGHSLRSDYTDVELEQVKRSFTADGLSQKVHGAEAIAAVDPGGTLLGMGAQVPHESRPSTSRLRVLFVARDAQGKGVGKRMAARLEECARAAGNSTIRLGAPRTATPLYRHLGYVVTEQPEPRPSTYLQMGKHLHGRVRLEQPGDEEQICEVILDSLQSMGGGRDESGRVDRLWRKASPYLSIAVEIGDQLIGHVVFSPAFAPG